MAKKKQRGGRTTPPKDSLRYTRPQSTKKGPSPTIVPVSMFTLFGLGILIIILNYFDGAPLLPGDTSPTNLLIGLGMIFGGFIVATQYH